MSRLALDGEEMTDDQRDAMCNLGESLGLTGGQAEDVIDEYLDEMSGLPPTPIPASSSRIAAAPRSNIVFAKPAAKAVTINTTPLARAQEKENNPGFTNKAGCEMFLITSGIIALGSTAREAAPHEQPITQVTVGCFFMSRFPITNAQYEIFDPSHRSKRARTANDRHPVIYVSSREAEKFCHWLSARENRKYRLPTEAEWEYAARAGQTHEAMNEVERFAWFSANTKTTQLVGQKEANTFGLHDLLGNVAEWCADAYHESYAGAPTNGEAWTAANGSKLFRVIRGESWSSARTGP